MERIIRTPKDKKAMEEVLAWYGIPYREVPESLRHMWQQIEFLTTPYGMRGRLVELRDGWFREASGAMLGFHTGSGEMLSLLPGSFGGYTYYDSRLKKRIPLGEGTDHILQSEAILFYRPFPEKRLGVPDLLRYIFRVTRGKDWIMFLGATVLYLLISLLFPMLVYYFLHFILLPGNTEGVAKVVVLALCAAVALELVNVHRRRMEIRIRSGVRVFVEAATMMRLLAMPARFFKRVGVAQQADGMYYLGEICEILLDCLSATLTVVLASILYLMQIYHYAKPLATISIIVIETMLIFTAILTVVQARCSRRQLKHHTRQTKVAYTLFDGIQKIKLVGKENRAFEIWKETYLAETKSRYEIPVLLKVRYAIEACIFLAGMLAVDVAAVWQRITPEVFFTWLAVFVLLGVVYRELSQVVLRSARIAPMLDLVKPLLDTPQESSREKEMVTSLKGGVELKNVSFRYDRRSALVLENLSMNIHPGEYVAIVGASGSGKSTLIRLLLGFETPEQGEILYDGVNMQDRNLSSLRRQMGVVLQNDTLVEGDFFRNLTLTRPWLSMDKVLEITDLVHLTEDIENLPMGFFTLVSEDDTGISRGQKQRIIVARALASEAPILLLDEATSALDNLSQQQITDAVKNLKATRIVIAHRLSAVKECDRILVLDQGRICEEGSYEELISKDGVFAKLADIQKQRDMVK